MSIIVPILIGLAILASGFFKDQNQQTQKNKTNTNKRTFKPKPIATSKRYENTQRTQTMQKTERPKRQSRVNVDTVTTVEQKDMQDLTESDLTATTISMPPKQIKKQRNIKINGNDLVRAVVMSEVIGSPKSKRK